MSASRHDPDRILKRLEWTVIRRLDGLLQGDYRTLFRGIGMDLADLREYQLHDDVRYIDWNVTARMQVPYVREYNEDREMTAWFLLDVSPSVDFGSTKVKKRLVLTEFVAVLMRLLVRNGNRIGAIMYSDRVDAVIPPQGGRRQILNIMNRLMAQPERSHSKATDLGEFLQKGFSMIRRRSFVFVVSDFISTPGWTVPLQQLSRRHETLAVRLFDPLENKLPDIGLFVMEDAETGEQLFVDTHDPGFRERFAAAARRRATELRSALQRAGVDTLELSTDDDLIDAILRFNDLRKQRTRLAAAGGLPTHLEVS